MPRAGRTFEEGRIYHVYNRVGGGWMVFEDEKLCERFVEIFRQVVVRDEGTSLGWCLLGNHYHLILRQGPVPLSRSLKTLQQGVTRARNLRDRTFGPLWQGRFNAKEVTDDRYLMQLVAYIHLNPVTAGLVHDPDQYRWSGHREIIGRRRNPIVAVDDVLLLFGQTRRRALRRYRAAMSAVEGEDWGSRGPGALPWWRQPQSSGNTSPAKNREAVIRQIGAWHGYVHTSRTVSGRPGRLPARAIRACSGVVNSSPDSRVWAPGRGVPGIVVNVSGAFSASGT